MPIYNLIEYSDNYCETLWQYYRDERSLNNPSFVNNSPGNSASFKFKQKITSETSVDVT